MHPFQPVTKPPFCPNPACLHHRDPATWRYKRMGFHQRKHPPFKVKRYKCLRCARTFSDQTFALGYWMRRQDLFVRIFMALVSCSGIRQIARQHSLTRVVVAGRVERLGRHCLLLNELLRPRGPAVEPLVLDGFESFEYSQYAPMHLNLLVGAESLFIHGFTESELRRKGRMTAAQKQRRAELEADRGRPAPDAIERGVETLLKHALPMPAEGGVIELRSDQHPAYGRAIRALGVAEKVRRVLIPSTVPRTSSNPLFPVNLTDSLLRHSSANHKRETIAWSKRRQCIVDRASVFVAWRNLLKSRSENLQNAPPAVHLGIVPKRLEAWQLLCKRLFATRMELAPHLELYYQRKIRTRYLDRQRVHELRFAY